MILAGAALFRPPGDISHVHEGSRPVLYKSVPLEVVELKADSDGMVFSGYASTFGNADHGGDVIERGAFSKTLRDKSRDRPLLWQHDMRIPIGVEKSIKEDGRGLLGTWEIIDTAQGLDAYKLLKRGAVRSMSIGYIPKSFEFQEGGEIRVIKEIDLLENSVVSIPMNDQARIQSIKSIQADDIAAIVQAVLAATQKQAVPAEVHNAVREYGDFTLAQLASNAKEIANVFGTRTRDLLEKLAAGDYDLTEAKRNDLQALLEMFSTMDAVRSDAEALLRPITPAIEPEQPAVDSDGKSALSLAIELRRHKLRAAHGLEV